MNKDYYKILGVNKDASESEIRKAFLKLSKKYHPDMQTGKSDAEKKESEEKFKELNEANEVLSDKNKRQQYDTFGSTEGFRSGFGARSVDPREFFRRAAANFHGFGTFDDDFGFNYDGSEARSKIDPTAPKNGRDIRINANFEFEDLLYGATRSFTVNVDDPCEHCHGTGAESGELDTCPVCKGTGMESTINGMMFMQSTCQNCNGSGYVPKKKCSHCNNGRIKTQRKLSINIPRGIEIGSRLKIVNEGEHGINGGKNGDFYIIVNSLTHDIFDRNGNDLATHIFISPLVASIGGEIDVQTPWGITKLKIPAGTKSGKVFRIPGQGVHSSSGNGDLYIESEIETISNITPEQKKAIEKLSKILKIDNFTNSKNLHDKCESFWNRVKDKAK